VGLSLITCSFSCSSFL
jgi:hypothetical protein